MVTHLLHCSVLQGVTILCNCLLKALHENNNHQVLTSPVVTASAASKLDILSRADLIVCSLIHLEWLLSKAEMSS